MPSPVEPELIARLLAEDAAQDDVTTRSLVPDDACGAALIRAKEAGVVAGLDAAQALFEAVDPEVAFEALVADGMTVTPGALVVRVAGRLRSLLAAERAAVNLLQRMSGIATLTARFAAELSPHGVTLLATRKTAPGLRALDIEAVVAGGASAHRGSLGERVLVKENHLAAARVGGGADDMADVVSKLLGPQGPRVPIGIEVTSLDELRLVLVAGIEVALLDNFSPDECRRAVQLRDAAFPEGGGPALEASGGITIETAAAYAASGVERISVGALTHSARALDLSMTLAETG